MVRMHGAHVKMASSSSLTTCRPRDVQARKVHKALADLGECVYVIAFDGDMVKIGWTSNLRQRLINLHVSRDDLGARLLLVKPGTLDDERALHLRFAEHVTRGREYFRRHPDLMAWVNQERAAMNLPAI